MKTLKLNQETSSWCKITRFFEQNKELFVTEKIVFWLVIKFKIFDLIGHLLLFLLPPPLLFDQNFWIKYSIVKVNLTREINSDTYENVEVCSSEIMAQPIGIPSPRRRRRYRSRHDQLMCRRHGRNSTKSCRKLRRCSNHSQVAPVYPDTNTD